MEYSNMCVWQRTETDKQLSESLQSLLILIPFLESMDIASLITSACSLLCNSMDTARLNYLVNLDQRVHSLTTALHELKDKRDDLKRQVERAESDGLTRTSQVKGWLRRVEDVEAQSSPIIEEALERRRRQCFWCCSTNCHSVYKLNKSISRKLREIGELMRKDVPPTDGPLHPPVEERPRRSTVGLDAMLEKVMQFLGENEVKIIGIYGIGGVGKTTLLNRINNEFLCRRHHYDVVIWVSVSKDFAVDKIQQAVSSRLGSSWEETASQEQRALNMYRVMSRKRFLLLLDDVWEGLDFEKIGIPVPNSENKCKVIFTTRSTDVCSDMDAHQKLKVDFLGENESWQLFREKVGGGKILDSPSVRPYAQTIFRKCGGLPLALITIGRAMANKETEEEWRYAIELLNNTPSRLRGMEDVFTLLKFSYDNLENDTLRSCFLYCSVFPEGYSIEKEQLVEYWIGQGFLVGSHDNSVLDKGYDIIGSLKVACLLETGEEKTQVKMHDVLRSFSLWMASECGVNKKKFLIEASMGLTEAPGADDWEEAQVISLLDNGITELMEIPICPELTTLLLQWNSGLNKMSNEFFECMPALRVLDLSFTSLKEIPATINKLVGLRHLDLSGTKITKLPKELGSLAKLRHLDLQRTLSLKRIPREAISGLSELRVLNFYYSYAGWGSQYNCNGDEVRFADLECLRHLVSLGITASDLNTLERLSGFSSLLKCIQYLYIKECEGLFHLPLLSTPTAGEKLRRLSINNCYDLKHLSIGPGAGQSWLRSLEILALHGLPNLTTVWGNPLTQGCLQNLRSVNIWYCHKLKNVSWVFRLPKLEVVYLFYCKEMEEIVSEEDLTTAEGDSLLAFPSLRTISIRDLPKLKSISPLPLPFPSLKSIAVIDCPNLKKLPIEAHDTLTLLKVYGNKEWWDGLVWDEAITNSSFLPHFMSI